MKALEKDRARRYGAPPSWLPTFAGIWTMRPVVARPASARYRLRKYTRRHRVAVVVAAGLVLLLAAFSGVTSLPVAAHHARARPR